MSLLLPSPAPPSYREGGLFEPLSRPHIQQEAVTWFAGSTSVSCIEEQRTRVAGNLVSLPFVCPEKTEPRDRDMVSPT